MYRRVFVALGLLAVVVFGLVFTGVDLTFRYLEKRQERIGSVEMRTKPMSVDLQGAEQANVSIFLPMGQLTVTNGTGKLMEGEFIYNADILEPDFAYSVRDGIGILSVPSEPESLGAENILFDMPVSATNSWNIQLNEEALLSLNIVTGLAQSTLELGGLNLISTTIELGAGESVIDLRGEWAHEAIVTVEAGLDDTTIRLPREMGVYVTVEQGIGDMEIVNLTQHDEGYVNAAYQSSSPSLTVQVASGVGDVLLEVEDE